MITIVESTRLDHREQAELLIDHLGAFRRANPDKYKSYQGKHTLRCVYVELLRAVRLAAHPTCKLAGRRIGVAGPPGTGKSTFIEALGTRLVEQDHKVAVVAIGTLSWLRNQCRHFKSLTYMTCRPFIHEEWRLDLGRCYAHGEAHEVTECICPRIPNQRRAWWNWRAHARRGVAV